MSGLGSITLFTIIPPKEWQIKIMGRSVASSSCVWLLVLLIDISDSTDTHTSRSATSSAIKVCACWSIRSEEVFPSKAATSALYPNDKTLDRFRLYGRRSGSPNQNRPVALVVHVSKGWPLRPWTATTLSRLARSRVWTLDVLYGWVLSSIDLMNSWIFWHSRFFWEKAAALLHLRSALRLIGRVSRCYIRQVDQDNTALLGL